MRDVLIKILIFGQIKSKRFQIIECNIHQGIRGFYHAGVQKPTE